MVATIENGTAHLAFLGAKDTPRVIARVMTDPFAEVPVTAAPVVVSITCSHTFTDTGLDPTKQWGYTVSSVSSEDQVSCDSGATAGPSPSTELLIAGVTLPPTEFPFFESAKSDLPGEEPVRVPALTLAEAAIAGQGQAPGDRTAQRGPGDDWSDVLFRYQAFIPEQYLALPTEPTGDPVRPILAFGGDNHGHNVPWGSYRFQIDTTVKFGSDHNVTSTVAMGMTYKYKCSIYITLCVELARQRQVNTQVGQATSPHTATTADVNVWSKTYNPLSPLAPAIDMTMKYKLRTSGSALIGVHDKMPRHEIFFGLPFSEWVPIYQSGFHSLPCLYAADVPVPALDLVCRSRLNVQF